MRYIFKLSGGCVEGAGGQGGGRYRPMKSRYFSEYAAAESEAQKIAGTPLKFEATPRGFESQILDNGWEYTISIHELEG